MMIIYTDHISSQYCHDSFSSCFNNHIIISTYHLGGQGPLSAGLLMCTYVHPSDGPGRVQGSQPQGTVGWPLRAPILQLYPIFLQLFEAESCRILSGPLQRICSHDDAQRPQPTSCCVCVGNQPPAGQWALNAEHCLYIHICKHSQYVKNAHAT